MNNINTKIIAFCMLLHAALCAESVSGAQTLELGQAGTIAQTTTNFHVRAAAPTNTAWTKFHPATNLSARRSALRELNLTTNVDRVTCNHCYGESGLPALYDFYGLLRIKLESPGRNFSIP